MGDASSKIARILNWIFVAFFAVLGLGPLATGDVLSAFVLWIVAIIISPPADAFIHRKLHFQLALWAKILIAVIGLVIALSAPTPVKNVVDDTATVPNAALPAAQPLPSQNTSKVEAAPVAPPAPVSHKNIKAALMAWGDVLPTEIVLEKIYNDTGLSADVRDIWVRSNSSSILNIYDAISEGYTQRFRYSNTVVGTTNIYRFNSTDSAQRYYLYTINLIKQARGYTALEASDDCFARYVNNYVVAGYSVICLRSDVVYAIGYTDNADFGEKPLASFAGIMDKQLK